MKAFSASARAFSLVEVTLSLGILAFSAVVILAMLPVGLNSARDANFTTVGARLAEEVQSELQLVGLASFQTNTTSFSADGRLVTAPSGAPASAEAPVYDVCRTVMACALPQADATPLKRVVVQVFNNPGRRPLSRDATGLYSAPPGVDERSFTFHVFAP